MKNERTRHTTDTYHALALWDEMVREGIKNRNQEDEYQDRMKRIFGSVVGERIFIPQFPPATGRGY